MGWSDFVGKPFTREDFADYVDKMSWTPQVWNPEKPQMPKGIVLHNTAAPTLAQWAESGPKHEQRIRNLRHFYENTQKWHGGPHLFVSRDWINVFDGLLERGTHSPSFNASHFGIEMVGDYDSEAFDSGDGAKVRDNAVFAATVLCLKFGWDPEKVIKLHKEDKATTHDCPGKNVVKADVVKRVKQQLAAFGKKTPTPMPMFAAAAASPHVSDEMRRRMVYEIYKDEARRDAKGRLKIYKLPKKDGGGKYEVAGINERFHPVEAKQLADLIEAGRHEEAEKKVQEFYMDYTNAVAAWTNDAGLEYWLRSTAFNRGRKGAAMTLQMALGVDIDGAVGDVTKTAVRAAEAADILGLFTAMRAARERYEREEAHRNEQSEFWKGLVNRWNKELADAHAFHAEQLGMAPGGAIMLAAAASAGDFSQGQKVPNASEKNTCGPITRKIKRTDVEFATLVSNQNPNIVFKNEEDTGADRMMTARLKEKLDALAPLVSAEWPGVKLRVTEAWDEDNEHSSAALHYEGRAADITTNPKDGDKLGRLARLAVNAGFDWVLFEDTLHVHVSVKKA